MPISATDGIALLVSVGIVVLGLWGFFALADYDYRVRHTDTTVSIAAEAEAHDFHRLDTRELKIFEEATTAEAYVSEDPVSFPETVQRNDTYYDFESTSAHDWTDPLTIVPVLTILGGIVSLGAAGRRIVR